MHIVVRGDGRTVQRRRLIVPPPQGSLNFLCNPVVNRLHDLCFNHVAFGVDRDLDYNIPDQIARQLGTVHGRIRIHHRIRDVYFVARDRTVDNHTKRRPRLGVFICLVCLCVKLM